MDRVKPSKLAFKLVHCAYKILWSSTYLQIVNYLYMYFNLLFFLVLSRSLTIFATSICCCFSISISNKQNDFNYELEWVIYYIV